MTLVSPLSSNPNPFYDTGVIVMGHLQELQQRRDLSAWQVELTVRDCQAFMEQLKPMQDEARAFLILHAADEGPVGSFAAYLLDAHPHESCSTALTGGEPSGPPDSITH